MQTHVNSGLTGTVEPAVNRFNKLATPNSSGALEHRAAMDKRLALLQKAMGNEAPPQRPAPSVPRQVAPEKVQTPAASLRPFLLMGTACLIAVAGVLWLLLQDSRSTPVVSPVANTITVPVAAALIPAASTPTPPPPARTDEDEARAVVETWRQAWSRRDVNAYLGQYSAQFVPVNGQTQAQWAASRRKIISGRNDIQVIVRDVRVQRSDDGSVDVAFLQDYAAGDHRETALPKILQLRREDSGWRIVSERALPAGAALTP